MIRTLGVYAGSFDPPTHGHLWMIREGIKIFDTLTVVLAVNPDKKYRFTSKERLMMLKSSVGRLPGLSYDQIGNEFLVHYAQNLGATHILRGLRSEGDFRYEWDMRQINADIVPEITTVFLMPPREIAEVSSSMVKGLVGPMGWQAIVRKYVPTSVLRRLARET